MFYGLPYIGIGDMHQAIGCLIMGRVEYPDSAGTFSKGHDGLQLMPSFLRYRPDFIMVSPLGLHPLCGVDYKFSNCLLSLGVTLVPELGLEVPGSGHFTPSLALILGPNSERLHFVLCSGIALHFTIGIGKMLGLYCIQNSFSVVIRPTTFPSWPLSFA